MNVRVSGIVFVNEKLVVVKHENRTQGIYYLLPGGGLEMSETIEECAVREVKEETGLDVEIRSLAYYEDVISKKEHTLHLIFWCNLIGGNAGIQDPDNKVKEIVFLNREEFFNIGKFFPERLKSRLFEDVDSEIPISLGRTDFPG